MPNRYRAAKALIISISATCGLALAIYKYNTDIIAKSAHKQQDDLLSKRISVYKQQETQLFDSVFRHIALPQTVQEAESILSRVKRLRPSDRLDNNELRRQSEKVFQKDINVESMSLLTNGGINVLSTNLSLISQYQPLENTATLIDPLISKDFSLTFLMDALSRHPSLSVVLPIRNKVDKRIGYYGLKLKPSAIYRSIRGAEGIAVLSPPETVNAVSYTSANDITEIYKPNSALPYRPMKSLAIINGFNHVNGPHLYLDHRKRPVVGAYAMVKSANMVVLVEREQRILFKREVERLRQVLLIGLLASFAFFTILIRQERSNASQGESA